VGPAQAGWLPPEATAPQAGEITIDLQIFEEKDGFFLVSESSHVHFRKGDTWNSTLEEAMAQAEYQFGVKLSEWKSPAST